MRVPATLACLLLTVGACGSDSNGAGSGCAGNLGGTWSVATCSGADTCTLAQSACSVSATCLSGASLSGTLSGASLALSGMAGNGAVESCQGTLSGDTFTGSCSLAHGAPCSTTATKQ